jgi:hypothetical protein
MANRKFTLPFNFQKLCIFMLQVTMQLAALNGKELMTVQQGTLWDNATVY